MYAPSKSKARGVSVQIS